MHIFLYTRAQIDAPGRLEAHYARNKYTTTTTTVYPICESEIKEVYDDGSKGRFRPLKKFEKFGIFSKLSKLSKLPRSTMWKWTSTSRSVLVHFHIVESWKVGNLENTPRLLQPRCTVLSGFTAKENKDRSAQSVQDGASLSPAATRAGFSSAPRPQISIAHGIRSVTLGHN